MDKSDVERVLGAGGKPALQVGAITGAMLAANWALAEMGVHEVWRLVLLVTAGLVCLSRIGAVMRAGQRS